MSWAIPGDEGFLTFPVLKEFSLVAETVQYKKGHGRGVQRVLMKP